MFFKDCGPFLSANFRSSPTFYVINLINSIFSIYFIINIIFIYFDVNYGKIKTILYGGNLDNKEALWGRN
jgi:hypothetical protein